MTDRRAAVWRSLVRSSGDGVRAGHVSLRSTPSIGTVALAAALLAACSDDVGGRDQTATPASTSTTSTTAVAAPSGGYKECVSPAGYRLEYPATWSTSEPSERFPCRFFHPEPLDLPQRSEATGIAITVQMAPAPFERVVPPSERSQAVEVLSRADTLVAGRPAVRLETRATGGALLPSGVRGVTYYADFGSRTLVASTSEAAAAGTFEGNVAVLDRMMASVRAESRSSTCSAHASTSEPTPQPALPSSVADMRASIVEAATQCDYRELARLAMAGGTTFTYSFGDHGDPAEFWRRLESRDEPVLSILVELLERPFSTRTVEGTTQYLWPSAYAYERWSDVPKAEREALRPLYSDEDFRRFEQFGSYAGYRVGIVPGDWIFFVAGD